MWLYDLTVTKDIFSGKGVNIQTRRLIDTLQQSENQSFTDLFIERSGRGMGLVLMSQAIRDE